MFKTNFSGTTKFGKAKFGGALLPNVPPWLRACTKQWMLHLEDSCWL